MSAPGTLARWRAGASPLPLDGSITGLVAAALSNQTTFCSLYPFLLQINKNTENIYYSNKTFPLRIDFQGLKRDIFFLKAAEGGTRKRLVPFVQPSHGEAEHLLDRQEHGLYLPTDCFSNNEKQ